MPQFAQDIELVNDGEESIEIDPGESVQVDLRMLAYKARVTKIGDDE